MNSEDSEIRSALDSAWNVEAAQTNLDRWLDICNKEGWGRCPDNLPLLTKLFGASWFFTRFVFFLGNKIVNYFDHPVVPDCSISVIRERLLKDNMAGSLDERMDLLRLAKNEVMLQIVLAYFTEQLDQEQEARDLLSCEK